MGLMDKIAAWLPHDKALHLLAGVVLTAVLHPLLVWLDQTLAMALTAMALIVVGFGKETIDALLDETHIPDPWDALATLVGGLLVLLPLYVSAV
jgi:hypothetical protein